MISSDMHVKNRMLPAGMHHPCKYTEEKELTRIAEAYNLQLKTVHNKIKIEGSPERSLFRTVIEDIQNNLYILEKISTNSVPTKIAIAKTLDTLSQKGLQQIQPYLETREGEHILHRKNQYWQMIPYLEGIDLPRPDYVYDQWRGKLFATFLINLKKTASKTPLLKKRDSFSIKKYIRQLVSTLKKNNPKILQQFQPILDYLSADYLISCEKLPHAFCHGDFHPLNMIWSENTIKSVIDWEFAGDKTEIYDVANMIGCVGIEDPESLTGPLVIELIKTLKGANIYTAPSWDYLLDAIIAQRFAWLSEWLRKNDLEMQEMEYDYLSLLIENKDILTSTWNNFKSSDEEIIYV